MSLYSTYKNNIIYIHLKICCLGSLITISLKNPKYFSMSGIWNRRFFSGSGSRSAKECGFETLLFTDVILLVNVKSIVVNVF